MDVVVDGIAFGLILIGLVLIVGAVIGVVAEFADLWLTKKTTTKKTTTNQSRTMDRGGRESHEKGSRS